jgi:hypothetical protein
MSRVSRLDLTVAVASERQMLEAPTPDEDAGAQIRDRDGTDT